MQTPVSRLRVSFALGAFVALFISIAASPVNADDGKVGWKDGFSLRTSTDTAEFRVGGRIQLDSAFIATSHEMRTANGSPVTDHFGFRRARLYIDITLHKHVEMRHEIETSRGNLQFADAYVGLKGGPAGLGLRLGHFKEPFGLEEMTSANFHPFLERSVGNAFAPVRNLGAMVYMDKIHNSKITAWLGVFRTADDKGLFGDDMTESRDTDYSLTGRITAAPLLENGGEKLFHLGFGYSRREYHANTTSLSTRPETGFFYLTTPAGPGTPPVPPAARVNGTILNTGDIATASGNVQWGQLFGFEGAVGIGPVSLRSEYHLNMLDTATGNRYFYGFHALGSVFLTGEHHPYARGRFVRPKPKTAAFDDGIGAIELALRYSRLDLNDGPVTGGHVNTFGVALNWYLNPNTRFGANYIHAHTSRTGTPVSGQRVPGYVNAVVARFQVDI